MLIRVSGKLNDARPFATRIEAPNIFAAIQRASESLENAKVVAVEIRARPLDGKSSVTIGKPRAPKAKKVNGTSAKK
jgi:hypothetical protein